jgi:radical SAM superfamily enzyme
LNAILEIGIESIHSVELNALNRKADTDYTGSIIESLVKIGITVETTLMYGLPNQTVDSFSRSVRWLEDKGVSKIKCFPLLLLPGTEIRERAPSWKLEVEELGEWRIPTVVSGNTFNRDSWQEMHEIAESIYKKSCS